MINKKAVRKLLQPFYINILLLFHFNSEHWCAGVIYKVATDTSIEEMSNTLTSVREHTYKVYIVFLHIV